MRELAKLLRDNEDWLMNRTLAYSIERGYNKYTSILPEAWRASISGLSEALLEALPRGQAAVELGPDERFDETPLEAFALEESKRHRARGVNLGMFLGLLVYYRQAYQDLVEQAGLAPALESGALRFVTRFFDRLATAVAVDWNAAGESAKIEELRRENLRGQNRKHHLLTVFQALPSAVLLADVQGRITDLNHAASTWLEQLLPTAAGQKTKGENLAFLGLAVEELLPWVGPALARLRAGQLQRQSILGQLNEGERIAFLDTRLFPLFGIEGGYEGVVVVVQDVTALHSASEAQARTAAQLSDKLREASSLNRLTEVLGQKQDSIELLMQNLVEALPGCWEAPDGLSAKVSLDGQNFTSPGWSDTLACGQSLDASLILLGEERGSISLRSLSPDCSFQPSDASMLSAIARHLEHALETRLSLQLLSNSERQFREFFNSAADAIFIHDETGRILDANKNAGIWLNAATESLVGKNLLESVSDADREATQARFLNTLRGDPELFQAVLKRRDGFSIPAELLCQAQNYQGQPALITSGRNITGRLRTQAEIERRLDIEGLVSGISSRLINATDEDMPKAIEDSLAEVCRFLGMQRAGVFLLNEKSKAFELAYRPPQPDGTAQYALLKRFSRANMPWFTERIFDGERVFIRDAGHMPPAGRKEKLELARLGIASLAAVPMTVKGRLLGVLAVASSTPQDTARLAGSRVLDQATLLFSNAIHRRSTAEALRRSESLARAILDALPANICVLDRRGVLTMINRSWSVTGPESTPLGGQTARLALGDNYLDACRAAADNPGAAKALEGILAVLAHKTRSFRCEYPGSLHGEPRWYVMQVAPFSRGTVGAVVSHRDITDRMRANDELRQSEERFRIIVETAQEAVINIDADSRISYANPRAIALFGYSQEELLGLDILKLIDPLDHKLLQKNVERRRKGLADQYELRFRHKGGHRIWTMLSASPLRSPDGAYAGSVGMITDISDRMRAEIRLRRNESRYRTLVESMHEGLIMARRGGIVSYANDRFCAMLGRDRKELVGQPMSAFVDAGSRKRLEKMLADSQSQSHVGRAEEILWEHVGGRHIYSLVSPSAYADEDGKPAGFFAIVTDTTDRKGLESQLLQSQKLEAIGQLAAGIAHEINTPAQYVGNNVQFIKGAFEDVFAVLDAVRGFISASKAACPGPEQVKALEALVQERDVDYLCAEVPGAIAQTLEGVERISTIVRSVKQFAHPGAAVMASADLNESMKSTATVSRNEWKYVAELDLALDPALPMVVCMIGEINQVVLNLIINAAHAIADAKKVQPEREGRITLATRLTPPWAEIRVADTGTGIPASVQAKIFDPFFTTKEVGRGTGQGLTISRSIVVEKHKGQLFFETQEGVGTTFVVRLPLEQSSTQEES